MMKHSINNWASKVTFGGRVWPKRSEVEIPTHHRDCALFLATVSGIGFFIAINGSY